MKPSWGCLQHEVGVRATLRQIGYIGWFYGYFAAARVVELVVEASRPMYFLEVEVSSDSPAPGFEQQVTGFLRSLEQYLFGGERPEDGRPYREIVLATYRKITSRVVGIKGRLPWE